MKRALVCGASGFIGNHLAQRLVDEGYWVRGVDIAPPHYRPTVCHSFAKLDLRSLDSAWRALAPNIDEVYQLAADMGGMGYIDSAECEIMRNNTAINASVLEAAGRYRVRRYLFASSACVYRDMAPGEAPMAEDGAYPAMPHNEYGWEKLYGERMTLAYGKRHSMSVRIARFGNTYGPYGAWVGGREKAPAALCRKIAVAGDGDEVEVWGDGTAVRSYTYIDDLIDGIRLLMESDIEGPVNIGTPEHVTVDELAQAVADIAGKRILLKHVDGPTGVRNRNFSNQRAESLGWQARTTLRAGLARTYPWIAGQAVIA